MKKCKKCGKEISSDAKHCSHCGEAQSKDNGKSVVKMTRDQLAEMIKGAMDGVRDDLKNQLGTVDRRHVPAIVTSKSGATGPARSRSSGMGWTKLSEKAVSEMTPEERGDSFARCIRYLAASHNNVHLAIEIAAGNGDKHISETWEKALGESTLAGGGAILPPEFSDAIIELLTPASVVRRAGPTIMPMNTGSLTLPFISAGATASYVGENQNITSTQPAFGQLQLSDKKLAALIPTSNDLLRNGGARADTVIRGDIVRAMRVKEDITFIRSDGTQNEPKGLLNLADTGNKFDANATANSQNVARDLANAQFLLEDADVDMAGTAWLFSPRTKQFLLTLQDADGRFTFKEEIMAGELQGWPFHVTSQIPNNLGGGTNESEVYLAAFPTLVLAENETLTVEVFPGGAYFDGSTVISGISQDQTVIRAIALHDFGARQRGKEIAIIEKVIWSVP